MSSVEFSRNVSVVICRQHGLRMDGRNQPTFTSDQIAVQDSNARGQEETQRIMEVLISKKDVHIIWLFVCKHSPHESRTVHVLLGTPSIPRILAEMQVREDRLGNKQMRNARRVTVSGREDVLLR